VSLQLQSLLGDKFQQSFQLPRSLRQYVPFSAILLQILQIQNEENNIYHQPSSFQRRERVRERNKERILENNKDSSRVFWNLCGMPRDHSKLLRIFSINSSSFPLYSLSLSLFLFLLIILIAVVVKDLIIDHNSVNSG